MHNLICQNPKCGKDFEAKRIDAKYCSEACKKAVQRANKKAAQKCEEEKRKREAPLRNEIADLTQLYEALRAVIRYKAALSKRANEPKPTPLPKPPKSPEQINLEVEISDWKRTLSMSDLQFYNICINPQVVAMLWLKPPGKSWIDYVFNGDRRGFFKSVWTQQFNPDQEMAISYEIRAKRNLVPPRIAELELKLRSTYWSFQTEEQKPEITKPELSPRFGNLTMKKLADLNADLKATAEKLAALNNKLNALPEPEPAATPTKPVKRNPRKSRNAAGGYTPEQLRNMEFDLLDLSGQGELGEFLGDIEARGLAIALMGDPTAGKSTFSFTLAKLFIDIGMTVRYFSLEEGVAALTTKKLDHAGILDSDPFKLTGGGTLNDIRKAAKNFDVVAVDSWSVLDVKPEEFQRLRADFPGTIFIVIFQKTNAGTIRGGKKLEYDPPMRMNLYREGGKRMIEMEKSRYGTQGWIYSITDEEIVFDGEEEASASE